MSERGITDVEFPDPEDTDIEFDPDEDPDEDPEPDPELADLPDGWEDDPADESDD